MKIPRNTLTDWYVASVPAPKPYIPGRASGGWRPCIDWCAEQWPEGENIYAPHSTRNWRFVGDGVFEFRRQEDLLLFVLRWS